MAKTAQKSTNNIHALVLTGALIVITAVLGTLLYTQHERINDIELQSSVLDITQSQDIEMLQFCLANSIADCSEAGIATWNEAHPDNTFTVKSLQEITEDALEGIRVKTSQ